MQVLEVKSVGRICWELPGEGLDSWGCWGGKEVERKRNHRSVREVKETSLQLFSSYMIARWVLAATTDKYLVDPAKCVAKLQMLLLSTAA